MNQTIPFFIGFLLLSLFSCTSPEDQQTSPSSSNSQLTTCWQPGDRSNDAALWVEDADLNELDFLDGQKVYVPIYSELSLQIYLSGEESSIVDFTGTLSIRNTSENDSIYIRSVRYFDTNGQLVDDCIAGKNIRLAPLATTEFGIARSDRSGGSGANFIVEWVSESEVSEPLIESIMFASAGNRGHTFSSQGRVVEELE